MKRAAFLPLIMILTVLIGSVSPAQAASATVKFSGPDKVKAGQTYTYTYEINVTGVAAARIVPVTASGAFEIVSGGEGLLYDTIPNNTSGASAQGSIVVRVKNDASPGDKATLSTSGDYAVLDEQYNQTERVFSASFIASVTTGSASKPSPTPTETQSPTPEPTLETPSPSPVLFPSPTVPPAPSASPTDAPSLAAVVTASAAPEASALVDGVMPAAANSDSSWHMPPAVIIAVAAAVVMIGVLVVMLVRRSRQFNKRGATPQPAAQPAVPVGALRRADMKKHRKKPKHKH
jgi:hypothetical protein